MSQSTFPASVSSRKHRWPIPNFGGILSVALLMWYCIRWCVTHLGLCPNGPHARVFGILQPLILVTRFELSQRGPRLP